MSNGHRWTDKAMTCHGRAIVGTIAMLLAVPLVQSAAQAGSAHAADVPGAIVVQVTDTSLNPLPAEIMFPALGVGLRLSAEGTVVLVSVPDGLYLLEVRHDGHTSDSRLLRVAGDTVRVGFVLSPVADEQGRPNALAAGGLERARLRSFIERRATMTSGTFLTRAAIEREGERTAGALLRGMRNVRVERGARGRTIVRSTETSGPDCDRGMLVFVDGAAIASSDDSSPGAAAAEHHSRAQHSREARRRLTAGGVAAASPALRWVGPSGDDLVRVAHDPASVTETTAGRGPRVTDIDRMKASSLVAVEIYASPGSAPREFQLPGAQCGVVLIWTAGA